MHSTNLFDRIGEKRTRYIFKAADIAAFSHRNEVGLIREALEECSEAISRVDVFYTRYNTQRLPKIYLYSEDRPDSVLPVKFIRKTENSYPHICVWAYLSMYREALDCTFYLDHFEGELTPAWDQISSLDLNILFKGDQCNPLISLADFFIRYLDRSVKENNIHLAVDGIRDFLKDTPFSNKSWIKALGGTTDVLHNIAPYSRSRIDISKQLARPLIFIYPENPAGITSGEEKSMIEQLPIFDAVLDLAYNLGGGGVKFFSPRQDTKLVKDGDYFLTIGDKGKDLFDYLTKSGVKIKRLKPKDLLEKG